MNYAKSANQICNSDSRRMQYSGILLHKNDLIQDSV